MQAAPCSTGRCVQRALTASNVTKDDIANGKQYENMMIAFLLHWFRL
jgi:hypothetical protein